MTRQGFCNFFIRILYFVLDINEVVMKMKGNGVYRPPNETPHFLTLRCQKLLI